MDSGWIIFFMQFSLIIFDKSSPSNVPKESWANTHKVTIALRRKLIGVHGMDFMQLDPHIYKVFN